MTGADQRMPAMQEESQLTSRAMKETMQHHLLYRQKDAILPMLTMSQPDKAAITKA